MSKENPNFTIITNGGCNAKCDFCTDSFTRKAAPDYLAKLVDVLYNKLPERFKQCSISGGEPTVSPDLANILSLVTMSKKFDKVVLTTNGAKLVQHSDLLIKNINHLNVSRHAIGYEENVKIFGTKDIIKDDDLRKVADKFNAKGIDVNLNFVYGKDSKITEAYVREFIDYAKSVGATSVSWRYDQNENTLASTYLEKLFENRKKISSGACPVCRNHSVLVNGFHTVFKASIAEPSKALGDLYELIYHIDGTLALDWDGKTKYDDWAAKNEKNNNVVAAIRNRIAVNSIPASAPALGGGCGGSLGGGCGSSRVSEVQSHGGGCGFGGGCA